MDLPKLNSRLQVRLQWRKHCMNFCPWWHLKNHSRSEDDEDTWNSHINNSLTDLSPCDLHKTGLYYSLCCQFLWKTREIELIKLEFMRREEHWVAVLGSICEWNTYIYLYIHIYIYGKIYLQDKDILPFSGETIVSSVVSVLLSSGFLRCIWRKREVMEFPQAGVSWHQNVNLLSTDWFYFENLQVSSSFQYLWSAAKRLMVRSSNCWASRFALFKE